MNEQDFERELIKKDLSKTLRYCLQDFPSRWQATAFSNDRDVVLYAKLSPGFREIGCPSPNTNVPYTEHRVRLHEVAYTLPKSKTRFIWIWLPEDEDDLEIILELRKELGLVELSLDSVKKKMGLS